ncbi:MAG: hypothetical protein ACRD1J_12880, partial [Terriglobia bacterium]
RAREALRDPLLPLPIHPEAPPDPVHDLSVDSQLPSLAGLLQGLGQAAGIPPVLERVQRRAGLGGRWIYGRSTGRRPGAPG